MSIAVETFRNLLAEYTLDSLFQPTTPGAYPYGDFQARVATRVKEAQVLADRGLIIFAVGVGALKLPREVVNQRVRNWQARWQKAVIQNYAAGKGQAIQTQGRRQIEAQNNILETLKIKLEQAVSPAEKRALALALITALQRAMNDPATRQLVPNENLRTLESLPNWLKG